MIESEKNAHNNLQIKYMKKCFFDKKKNENEEYLKK